jgi:hypothetical protein
MSHTLYDRLAPQATRQRVAVLMVIFLVLFLVVFPAALNRLKEFSGGVGLIDTQFTYTPDQAFQMVSAYGPEGRPLYILTTLTADLLYPLDYSLLLALLLILLYSQAFPVSRLIHAGVWLPFITGAMDLLENACVVTLLATFPQPLPWVAQAAGLFTPLKWIFLGVSLLLVLVGFIGLLVARLRG